MNRVAESLALLPGWLAAASNADVATGLSRSEAASRAAQLRNELLRLGPKGVKTAGLDEDSKDTLYALVEAIEVNGPRRQPPDQFAQANMVYEYLTDLSWAPDDFGERLDLMRRCAREGWRALGIDMKRVEAVRTNPGSGQHISFDLCLPDRFRRESPGLFATAERGRQLATLVNSKPVAVAASFVSLYEKQKHFAERRILDVPDYLSGAVALHAGGAFRMAGALDTAEAWLNRAEEHFATTTDPAPLFVRVLGERLVLTFDRRQPREACEMAPKLMSETKRLGMHRDFLRVRLVYGASLRVRGLNAKAIEELCALKAELNSEAEPMILICTLAHLANALVVEGRFREAASLIEEGYRVNVGLCLGKPHLDSVAGLLLRRQGRLAEAIEAFRLSVSGYREMGAQENEAETRVALAESLVAANRYREAESEIRCAMPILEGSKLVVETLAAIVILRDSMRRRKLDPEASSLSD